MGDFESESLTGDAGGAEAGRRDEAIDPVKAAEADAWLAQFRAENAAKVMEHNFEAGEDAQAEVRAEAAKRDYELSQAKKLADNAVQLRAEAAAFEEKAAKDAARHDEYATQAQIARQEAESADGLAAEARADAAAADEAAKRQDAEVRDLYEIYQQNEGDYRLIQEQAVAAQRIATNEARLEHPGDPVPGDASGSSSSGPAGEPNQP
ncbi:MAG TPA: hypothetical protein VEO91_12900 [Candidatus Limnocylindria bacterium]|nr:hypothetical protein [Candidatus Limnocylindria bacterium]